MNKKIALLSIILVVLMTGCSLVTQFQSAREQYLETRVVELLDEMEVEEEPAAVVEATATEEAIEEKVEETEEVEETAVTEEEPTAEPTEEAEEAEETEEAQESEEEDPKSLSTDPGVYLGDPDWEDDMTAVGNWSLATDDYLAAAYDDEALMIRSLTTDHGWRVAYTGALEDAYIEAKITAGKCAGSDAFGLMFRMPENIDYRSGYLFVITCEGTYALRKWDGLTGANGAMEELIEFTESGLIDAGEDGSNRLGILTVGDSLTIFLNGEEIGQVTDDSFEKGFFGIYLNADKSDDLTIYVDDVKYWVDPEVK